MSKVTQTIKIYCHDGEIRHISCVATLELIQSLVGGLIEQVPGYPDHWVNEEGLLISLPLNRHARKFNQPLVDQIVHAKLS